jgi:hypothetical protein
MNKLPVQPQDRSDTQTPLTGYCRHIDPMNLDALAALFTEDCFVECEPEADFSRQGPAKLRRNLGRTWRCRRTAHRMSNIEIAFIDDDEAHVLSYVIAWQEVLKTRTARSWCLTAAATTRWCARKQAGTWRRQLMNVGGDHVLETMIDNSERRPVPATWSRPRSSS